jgi:hypothetical protein
MMTRRFRHWLSRKWTRRLEPGLADSYRATFSTFHGERVLQHLLDGVYCQVYEGKDPIEAAHHNGRRSVVQEILENIELAEHPEKHTTDVKTEAPYGAMV